LLRSNNDGAPLTLNPRVFDTLLYFVEHRGELLDKPTLMKAIWPDTIVEENNLNQNISALRRVLGESRNEHRYIVTVPGCGYQFVADVTTIIPETPSNSHSEPAPRDKIPIARFSPASKPKFAIRSLLVAVFAVALVAAITIGLYQGNNTPTRDLRSIAVLPFSNQSAAEENAEFLAAGIHDDILTQLAKIRGLKVISRTSVMEYRDTLKNLRDIGRELGVATILEGEVRRAGDWVRINAQLIDTENDEHLWAESYDRALTAENVFAIQSEMAASIAAALHATLSPEEAARLNAIPTRKTLAYEYYQNGRDYIRRGGTGSTDLALAVQSFERAVQEDPDFVQAWLSLARAHQLMYFNAYDRSETRLQKAEAAIRRAQALAPDAPEIHLLLGGYYLFGLNDVEAALQQYAVAERGLPGDASLFAGQATIRVSLGDWDEGLKYLARAIELDPRNAEHLNFMAFGQLNLRNYDEADRYLDRALAIAPDHVAANFNKALLPIWRDGDTSRAKALMKQAPSRHHIFFLMGWMTLVFYERDYQAALDWLEDWDFEVYQDQYSYIPKASIYGVTYQLAGNHDLARDQFLIARRYLEEALAAAADDPRLYTALGEALAGLGEFSAAAQTARQGLELLPPSRNAILGTGYLYHAIMRVFAAADRDAAITELDNYLSVPSLGSIEGIMADARLNGLRDDPRFQALVEKYKRR
jgi:adenylate cyclase